MKKIFIRSIRDFKSLEELKPGEYIVTLESDLDFKDEPMRTIYIKGSSIIFDGDGHKVRNIFISKPNYDVIGLFNTWDRSSTMVIKNVIFENINITGRNYVGLIGGTFNGVINNCKINGSVNGISFVGGLVGTSPKKLVVNSTDLDIEIVSFYEESSGLILGDGRKLIVRKCNTNEPTDSKYYVQCDTAEIEGMKYRVEQDSESQRWDLSLKRKKQY